MPTYSSVSENERLAYNSTDFLLVLLEDLGIKSASQDAVQQEHLEKFVNRTHNLWRGKKG